MPRRQVRELIKWLPDALYAFAGWVEPYNLWVDRIRWKVERFIDREEAKA